MRNASPRRVAAERLRHRSLAATLAFALMSACGSEESTPRGSDADPLQPRVPSTPAPPAPPDAPDAPENRLREARDLAEEALERARSLYDRAREASDSASGNVVDWTTEDIKRIGDWEYRIEQLATSDVTVLSERLNEWGTERWEVYWIEHPATESAYTVFMKRPARSYLRHIPVGDLLRMVPGGSQE